ncbi:MAG: Alcohol dehydrogenase GroES domain protein [Phycisphaerales bacterium]|nr:Alcohol dehydrogenase GroES domain protein [Phycisphaerales bacterium]
MRAMQLQHIAPIESSPLRAVELPDPIPGPGELRVRVKCCAICRTDLHVIEGDLPAAKMPVIPGHQVVGVVDALGPGCSHFKPGDRAGIAWLRHTDGICKYCKTGRENLCPNSLYTGYHADGGYAQFAVVPEDFAYAIPDVFSDVEAAPLLCAGIIGYRAMLRSEIRPGGNLALYGFGSSAHVVLQLARHRGCEVYVVTRGENHRQFARELGAKWAGDDAAGMPVKADAAILFAPAGTLVPPALAALDRGGVLALAGIHMSPIPPLDYDTYLFQERDIHPVTANTRGDGRELLAEAAQVPVRPHVVTYPLSEANHALQDMKADRIDGTGVLMVDDAG